MKNVLLGFEVDNYAARSTLAGILKFASAHGAWELRIATVPDPLTADMIRHAPSEGIDGIIANGVVKDAAISALAKTPLPVCLVESADEFIPKRRRAIARACNDNRKIGALGAKHLLDLGRFSSYAFAPHPDAPPWSENRRKGFVEELARHGIQAEILTGDIADGLSLLAKPAAVMAAWDYKAIEIVRCARNAGLRIPEHVAVIGVDSDPLICDFTNPPLTSVAPDFEGLGFAAAEALESMMSGDGRKSTVRVCHPPKGVVKRGSS